MTVSSWYVDVDFISSSAIPDDVEFDVLEALAANSATISISRDRRSGGISLTVQADDAQEAAASLKPVLTPVYKLLGITKVTRLDVMDESIREYEIGMPTFPELVGYAEIAEMASVSRQRARQLASRSDFPVPAIETAAGPLRIKASVQKWLEMWDRTPGRPRGTSLN